MRGTGVHPVSSSTHHTPLPSIFQRIGLQSPVERSGDVWLQQLAPVPGCIQPVQGSRAGVAVADIAARTSPPARPSARRTPRPSGQCRS